MTNQSTINPTQPVVDSLLASAPVRDNFAAAYNDINNIYSLLGSISNGTMAAQNANNVTITGGRIDGTAIGSTNPNNGTFVSLTVTGAFTQPDNSINYNKIQQVSTTALLGNPAAGAADVTEIPINTTLDMSTGTLGVVNNTSTQKVISAKNGSIASTRHEINFIEGSGLSITVSDNSGADRTDVTFSAPTLGTVSSVAVSGANGIGVAGSPITTTGTIDLTLGDITPSKIGGTALSGTTGTTNLVFSNSPTLVSPSLGTPTVLVGTNITGTAASLTAGTATTLANNTANSLAGFNNSGVYSDVTVSTGLSLSGGLLTATASGGTVTTTGSPSSGNLSKFSGATAITNGDLAGDVTTSGTLTTTVSAIQGTSITGVTGTGNVVLDHTPTLITPVIGVATGTSLSVSGQLTSTIATGSPPFVVSSTTQVANLNAATAGSTGSSVINDSSTNATMYPTWVAGTSGPQALEVSSGSLTFNPSSGTLSSTTFVGALTGNASTATTATNATNTGITDDTTTNATMYPTWVTANTGNLPEKVTSTKFTFNPSTGILSSTSFTGAGTGLTGTAASLTAGNVTTNANLTGPITSVGNATSVASSINLPGSPTTTTQSASDSSTKVATTAYADTAAANAASAASAGLQVDAATTAAGDTSTWTYNNGASGVGATFTGPVNTAITIDGVAFSAIGKDLLVKNDTQSPSGAFNGRGAIFTRRTDYDSASDINDTGAIAITSGTVNGGSSYILTTKVTTVGTDPLTYTIFTPPYANIIQNGGALGTPASGTLTNCTGLPIATGVANLGAGIATFLTTPSSANLASAVTDETGSGALVFATSPTFVTPILGTPTSGNLANCTFPTLNQNTSGSAASLSVSGQTGLMTVTGLTSTNRIKTVRDAADTILELGGSYTPSGTWTSLTMVTPVLGTPTSGVLTNCTGTAASLTAGNVTTNANMTGDVTSSGSNATTVGAIAGRTVANTAVTVSSNAGTCPVTTLLDTFTNSSAATMAITIATSGATDGQKKIVRIYDFSGATQTIGWTNTENSTVSVPLISNGSTTLPLTVGFMYNNATSKWRCVGSA